VWSSCIAVYHRPTEPLAVNIRISNAGILRERRVIEAEIRKRRQRFRRSPALDDSRRKLDTFTALDEPPPTFEEPPPTTEETPPTHSNPPPQLHYQQGLPEATIQCVRCGEIMNQSAMVTHSTQCRALIADRSEQKVLPPTAEEPRPTLGIEVISLQFYTEEKESDQRQYATRFPYGRVR
jgi:hypothetical protein